MRLLDRYLLRELAVPLAFCLAGFLVFWISFDLLAQMDEFHEAHLAAQQVAQYYVAKTPEFLVTVTPIALLLALLYSLTQHARHHETTAMRAAGLSLWRISAVYFGVGIISSLLLFGLNESWAVRSAEAASQLVEKSSDRADRWYPRLNFRNARDGRTWNIGAFNRDTYQMLNPQVEWNRRDGSSVRILARSAFPTNGGWRFEDVIELIFPNGREFNATNYTHLRTNVIELAELTETPEQILSEIKLEPLLSGNFKVSRKAQVSLLELLDYFRLHPDLNRRDAAILKTQFHTRLAEPWTCLVVVLIALPFGAVSARRNVFVGVASSIFICFAFFIVVRLGLALGSGGYVAPWLAAWFPNLLFAGIGFVLTWLAR